MQIGWERENEEKHKISSRSQNKTDLTLLLPAWKNPKSESFVWKCKKSNSNFCWQDGNKPLFFSSVSKKSVGSLGESFVWKCKMFAGRMETNHYCRMLKVTSGNAFQKWPQGPFKTTYIQNFKTTRTSDIKGTEQDPFKTTYIHSRKKVGSWDPGSRSFFGPN